MRIALLSSQFPSVRLGGIGVYSLHCAAGLAQAGHEVHLFTLPIPPDARQKIPAPIILHEIPEPSQAQVFPRALPMGLTLKFQMATQELFAAAVRRLHQAAPFDILEAPEYEAPALALLADGDFPIITHLHSGTALARCVDHPPLAPLDQEQALRETLELHTLTAATALCAPSQAVIRETQLAYNIPNLAPTLQKATVLSLPFASPEILFTLPPENAPVLYVGRLELLKGAHLLAEAAISFLRRHPAATLRIVGPDTMSAPDENLQSSGKSMADWMRTRLAEFGPRVSFLGEQTTAAIYAEMRQSAFVIIPSLRESYSYVCCETLAAGRPAVVSSDIGATEVAADAGLPFTRGSVPDLARAMDQLWTDTALRQSLSRRAWDRARTVLSRSHTIAQRIAFYQQVIAQFHSCPAKSAPTLHPTHLPRLRVAQAQAHGDSAALTAALPQADLPPATLTPGMRLLQRLNDHAHHAHHAATTPVRFHFYGAGRHTARLLMEQSVWEAHGHQLLGLIDDHPRFQTEPRCFGLPVLSCAAAATQLPPGSVVILSTDAFEEQFWRNTQPLRDHNITVYKLYGTTGR